LWVTSYTRHCVWRIHLAIVLVERKERGRGGITFSISPPTKPTTTARPSQAIHFNESRMSPTGSYTTSISNQNVLISSARLLNKGKAEKERTN
jgi:hypothetical protein